MSAHRHADLAVDPLRAHVYRTARGRELHGVRQQVEDDLPDAALVALDDVDVGIRGERHAHAVLRRSLAHHDDAAFQRVAERERRDLELDLSRLDLGEVEHVVDEGEQVVGRREDVLEVLRLLLVDLADDLLSQHLGEAR